MRSQNLLTLKESFASGKVIEVNDRYKLCYIDLQTPNGGFEYTSKAAAGNGSKPEFFVCPQCKSRPQTGKAGSLRLHFIEPRWQCCLVMVESAGACDPAQIDARAFRWGSDGSCGDFRGVVPGDSAVAKRNSSSALPQFACLVLARGEQSLRDASVRQGVGLARESVTVYLPLEGAGGRYLRYVAAAIDLGYAL